MYFNGNVGCRHQPQPLGSICWTTDPLMTLFGCVDHKPQHGLRWLHRPLTSAWLPEVAKQRHSRGITEASAEAQTVYGITSFIVAWGSSLDHPYQHGLWWYCRPWWFLRPSSKKNPLSSLAYFITQSQGSPKTSSQVRGLNLYLLKHQAVVHYSANPTRLTMTACRPQSTLLPVTSITSLIPPLYHIFVPLVSLAGLGCLASYSLCGPMYEKFHVTFLQILIN